MDSSTSQHHHQEMANSQTLESMLVCTKAPQQEKKPRPPAEEALRCPRCDSTSTKFCYYNNYSLSQPRYFCKSCRRYWTKGGTLRNVPVGGGCRKNRRSSSSSSSTSSSSSSSFKRRHDQVISTPLSYDSSDLTLAFAKLQKQGNNGQLGFDDHHDQFPILGNPNNALFGPFDGHRNGFLEAHNNFQNLYYGHAENGAPLAMPNEDLMSGSTTSLTAVKQEMCNMRDNGDQNRVLWGFPFQINGGGANTNMVDLDSAARQSWNALGSSTWHGLINSPLM